LYDRKRDTAQEDMVLYETIPKWNEHDIEMGGKRYGNGTDNGMGWKRCSGRKEKRLAECCLGMG